MLGSGKCQLLIKLCEWRKIAANCEHPMVKLSSTKTSIEKFNSFINGCVMRCHVHVQLIKISIWVCEKNQ